MSLPVIAAKLWTSPTGLRSVSTAEQRIAGGGQDLPALRTSNPSNHGRPFSHAISGSAELSAISRVKRPAGPIGVVVAEGRTAAGETVFH